MAYSRNSPSRMKIKSNHKSEYADAPFVTEAWTSWGYRQSVSKAGQGRAGQGQQPQAAVVDIQQTMQGMNIAVQAC